MSTITIMEVPINKYEYHSGGIISLIVGRNDARPPKAPRAAPKICVFDFNVNLIIFLSSKSIEQFFNQLLNLAPKFLPAL